MRTDHAVERPRFSTFFEHLREGGVSAFGDVNNPRPRRERVTYKSLGERTGLYPGNFRKMGNGEVEEPEKATIDAIANALRLTYDEQLHCHELVRPPYRMSVDAENEPPTVDSAEKRWVDHHTAPCCYRDEAGNLIYANDAYLNTFRGIAEAGNLFVWLLLHREQAQEVLVEWEFETRLAVAWLRVLMARRPGYAPFPELLRQLSTSRVFADMWDAQLVVLERPTPYLYIRTESGGQRALLAKLTASTNPLRPLQVLSSVYEDL